MKDEFTNILDQRARAIVEGLQKPLRHDQIDFRVQSVRNGYAIILAYKDARCDMQRLDEVVGPMNWKREHNGPYCTVSIYNSNTQEWVSKQDIGTESNTEKEKGLASDSFKRACFNWGIGRELYDYPDIKVPVPQGKKTVYPNSWKWFSQFTDGKLTYLAAKDNGKLVYSYGKFVKS